MLRIGLTAPGRVARAVDAMERAAAYLRSRGAEVVPEEAFGSEPPEVLVALGGDGTMLRCAHTAAQLDVPMLGINLGTVGFLAEAEVDGLETALDRLLAHDCTEESRAMLAVTAGERRFLALNDAVISRGAYPRLIRLTARVDGSWAGDYRADGLLVATPTGSTGYSLSAGGPIIAPGVDCMLITPICPHSLQHRPQVIPGDARITLSIDGGERIEASLQIDGRHGADLRQGDSLTVTKAPERVRLIRMRETGFFDVVHQKLIEWSN